MKVAYVGFLLALLATGCTRTSDQAWVQPVSLAQVLAARSPTKPIDTPAIHLTAHVAGTQVQLGWSCPTGASTATLYRSTRDLRLGKLDVTRNPITVLAVDPAAGRLVDDTAADNATYYYRLQVDGRYSPTVQVTLPPKALPRLHHPLIHIDKLHYTLEVRDDGHRVKRYPVALGANPFHRKLFEDFASTPEGFYHLRGVQPQSTYHGAFDVSYPSSIDQFRYSLAERHHVVPKQTPIGGEIQIHGCDILHNWTCGCIALRDKDLQELLAHPEIGTDTPLEIVGNEITDGDLQSIRTPLSDTEMALARRQIPALTTDCAPELLSDYQIRHHLPVTAQLDARTRRLLTQQGDMP